MPPLYPLRFQPLFRQYLWGGRRLSSVLGKELPPGNDFAESWEVVDHPSGQSIVADGPLAGWTLRQLVEERGPELFGGHYPQPRFPLLFKYLDSSKVLSVQVHPNDEDAAKLSPPDFGKTEAWLVVHAEPGAAVFAGLKEGVSRADLEEALKTGSVEDCLHRFEPAAGDCLFIPAGVVHALGPGFVIAEIQQSSNKTYRLHDWNRVGPDGQPRELHLEESLRTIDFDFGPVQPQQPKHVGVQQIERLVECDKFVLDRHRISQPIPLAGDDRFHIVSVIEGEVNVGTDPTNRPLKRGETVLLPASVGEVKFVPSSPTTLIDMYLP